MEKRLENMTLQELWKLFPILLEPHREEWAEWFAEEKAFLQTLFPDAIINHIGSTAIPGIMAKPTVDILMEFSSFEKMTAAAAKMKSVGYMKMSDSGNRISFNKGYTSSCYADKVFHFHLRIIGDNAEIRFRDYLLSHPETAKEYESLKIELSKRYKYDRDAYTESKTDFIEEILHKHIG